MAKEKTRIEEQSEKIYFYEISSTIVILFSLITFSELGFVGRGLKNVFKILFGDYYFILIIFLILHGIIAMVKRRWFDFSSIKFNGFILFFLSIITLNHLGFYERLGFLTNEIFSNSLTTYVNTLKNLIQINSYGGGIVGALFLQILIFLFNQLGTIIMLIVFLVLSLSFMTNFSYKTILYYINIIYKRVRGSAVLLYRYFNNIKFPNKTIKKAKLNLNLNLNILDDCDNQCNEEVATKMSTEISNKLVNYLNSMNCNVQDSKIEVGYNVSRYSYMCGKIVYEKDVIKKITSNSVILYEYNKVLVLESTNKVKRLLSIKSLLLKSHKLPLGIEVDSSIVEFDPIKHMNILLTGSLDTGISSFIKCFIVANIFKYRYDFKLVILDYQKEYVELKYLPNLFIPYKSNKDDFINSLDIIAKELESRIELLHETGYSNYIEYNKLENNKIEVMYVILNNLDNIKSYINKQEAKLLYFLKFGFRVGIHFVVVNRSYGIDKEILVNIQTKLVFKCNDIHQSFEVLNNGNGCLLDGKRDVIVSYLNQYNRIVTPYISNTDYNKVISKFICN